ncbi:MAG: site-specific integrase [Nanoarchaeota archaeon]
MVPERDFHKYSAQLKRALQRVEESTISRKNKNIIFKFDKGCKLEGLSDPRRLKLVGNLHIIARDLLKKDFDKATKENVKDVVFKIESREDYSVWTKQNYRVILKKFYKWLKFGDDYKSMREYPPIVSWINTNVKNKDKPRIQASDILTEDEVKKLIDVADHPRDKAFISLLYELGARVGEIGLLRIKDVTKDKYSFIIDLRGKTGHRTPRVVISDPYLTNWLNNHPLKDDLNAPLWVTLGMRAHQRLGYASVRKLLARLKKKAGIKKRIYNHLFRHTRVTHLLGNKQINEAQAKVYFGWVPSSKMLSEYSHLLSSDVNDAILDLHGIKKEEQKESKLKPKHCPTCKAINASDALFCQRCSKPLDVKIAIELDEKRQRKDDMMKKLLEDPKIVSIMVDKMEELGLVHEK